MKVNVSVLGWIQTEKPEVWWHLVPVALCAGGQCPVSAGCSFIASGMSRCAWKCLWVGDSHEQGALQPRTEEAGSIQLPFASRLETV